MVTESGNALGSFCVIDSEPRMLSPGQIESLRALANQVVRLFELRKANAALVKTQQELEVKNSELEKFAYTVSHDIKSPLANIETVATILTEDYSDKLGEEGAKLISYLGNSSAKAKNLVEGILMYHTSDKIIDRNKEKVNLFTALNSIAEFINFKENIRFTFPEQGIEINTNRIALDQVFINLTNNAIKYNDKEVIEIAYGFKEDSTHYHFSVKDNGMGIPADKLPTIFNLFTTTGSTDRYGSKGTGIGLSTVKKLVERLGGQIQVSSTFGLGTEFTFSLSKF
ncbi:MAG: HAMP domain-containing histidine kinase [Sphingobacteriales bacterium JAD_PAG50586_3]|nr:MAG: HAMP domain-containing histidine kinase [Sphingobacteriales bacterium JAD_PAG50586_3]